MGNPVCVIAQLMRKWVSDKKVSANTLRRLVNWWVPFLGAGIRVQVISADFRYIRVHLKYRWYNRNYVGTQFGGSLYAMTDPWFMMMLIHILGKDYIVWDKGADIDFLKPGTTDVFAEFKVDDNLLLDIKERTREGEKYIFEVPVFVQSKEGQNIAKVIKRVYVRKKSK